MISYSARVLDPIWFTARVVAEMGRLGWARVRRDRDGVPARLEDIAAPWLERALAERFPGVRIDRFDVVESSAGTTARHRLELRYAEDGRAPGAPTSLFAKVPPGFGGQVFLNIFALGVSEVHFYRDVRPSLPVPAPDCFVARHDGSGGFVLLLENLETLGAEFSNVLDGVSVERAKAVATTLATLHAAYYDPELPRRFPWLVTTERATTYAASERFVCTRAHAPTMKRFAELLPESVRRGAARIHAERRALERYWASGPQCLIHGDPHAGNIYFVDGQPGFFDWQVVQRHQGIRDLAYFLVLSLETSVRRDHERSIVRHYLERLRDAGAPADALDPDRAWDFYRSFSLYAYIGTSVTASLGTLQDGPIARTGLRRAAAAVDDLDALALLGRIA